MKKLWFMIIFCSYDVACCVNGLFVQALRQDSSDATNERLKIFLSSGVDVIPLLNSNDIISYFYFPEHQKFLETQHCHVFSRCGEWAGISSIQYLQDKKLLMELLEYSNGEEDCEQCYKKIIRVELDTLRVIFKTLIDEPLLDYDHKVKHVHVDSAYGNSKHRLFLYRARKKDVEDYFGKDNIEYVQSLVTWYRLFVALEEKRVHKVIRLLRDGMESRREWYEKWKYLHIRQLCGNTFFECLLKDPHSAILLIKDFQLFDGIMHLPHFPVGLMGKQTTVRKWYETSFQDTIVQKALFELLIQAIEQDDRRKIDHLLQLGMDLKQKDELSHNGILHYVIRHWKKPVRWDSEWSSDHAWVFKSLVRKGASVHEANDYNVTPLALAVRLNKTLLAHLLLKAGASVHCFNSVSPYNNLLFIPVKYHNVPLVRELLDNGIFINKEYSKLAEDGFFGEPYTCTIISAMLKKAYQDPHYPYSKPSCHRCLKYTRKILGCYNATHQHAFLCKHCSPYIAATTNRCPACHGQYTSRESGCYVENYRPGGEYDMIDLF